MFEYFSRKLPISRLQRDLTDSTTLRNFGVPWSHTILGIQSLQRGFGKLTVHTDALHKDLDNNWAVISEAIQTILRMDGNIESPYELLKKLTRTGEKLNQQVFENFVAELPPTLKEETRKRLLAISPFNYTGIIPKHSLLKK